MWRSVDTQIVDLSLSCLQSNILYRVQSGDNWYMHLLGGLYKKDSPLSRNSLQQRLFYLAKYLFGWTYKDRITTRKAVWLITTNVSPLLTRSLAALLILHSILCFRLMTAALKLKQFSSFLVLAPSIFYWNFRLDYSFCVKFMYLI